MDNKVFGGLDPIGLESSFSEGAGEEERLTGFDEALDSPFAENWEAGFGNSFEGGASAWGQEQPGEDLAVEEGEGELSSEGFDQEAGGWTASSEQIAFRDRVYAAHLRLYRQRRGAPFPDLSPSQRKDLVTIPGTNRPALRATAEAAARLLGEANAALASARIAGDADALRTRRITINSGYRSSDEQRRLWLRYFPQYYRASQAARERIPGGPHSAAAADYMLTPKPRGFGLAGRIGAPGYSNHQNGIAVDFQQERTAGHGLRNSTSGPWPTAWRKTWFHHWLEDNARRFGFEPYSAEPWHWELRAPGTSRETAYESAVYEGGAYEGGADEGAAFEQGDAAGAPVLGGRTWTYRSQVTGQRVALYVPDRALQAGSIDLMLYAHGLLSPCGGMANAPEGFITGRRFRLGRLVETSGLPMGLVVPLFQEGNDKSWRTFGLDRPGTLNDFLAEAMTEIGRAAGAASLSRLIVAGHSRAFGILYPLARSHADPAHGSGALARLSAVWLLDATYGSVPLREMRAMIGSRPCLAMTILYRRGSLTDKFGGRTARGALRLQPIQGVEHCSVPARVLPGLLTGIGQPGTAVPQARESWSEMPSTATEWTEAGLAGEGFDGASSEGASSEGGWSEGAWSEDAQMLGAGFEDGRYGEMAGEEPEAGRSGLGWGGGEEQLAWTDYESGGAGGYGAGEDLAFDGPAASFEGTFEDRFGVEEGEAGGLGTETGEDFDLVLEMEAEAEAPTADAIAAGPLLRRGSRGPDVERVQRRLAELGINIAVDGAFGPATEGAVRAFQLRNGLSEDGVVGPMTRAALAAGSGRRPGPAPAPGPSPQPGPAPSPGPSPDGSEDVASFAERLAREWQQRSGGRVQADAKRQALLDDYEATKDGARGRAELKKASEQTIRKAWMISREQQMLFDTAPTAGIRPLGPLAPPAGRVDLVSDPIIGGSKSAPVAPVTVRFMQELKRRNPGVSAGTYPRHGSQGFVDRGYSVDLWVRGRDSRGFFPPEAALQALRDVDAAARAVNCRWRIIYNDFSVADAINRELGQRHVIFVGSPVMKNGRAVSLNWHGPDPFIVHFHLDLAPNPGTDGETAYEFASEEELEERERLSALSTLLESEDDSGSSLIDRIKGTAEFLLGPSLAKGSNGPAVAALQRALARLGHDIAADGAFGPSTDRAVKAFQAGAGLAADGVVGTGTKAAIAAALGLRPSPSPQPQQQRPTPIPPGPAPAFAAGRKLNPRDFVATFAAAARASEGAHGVPALVTLGQAALESGWGAHAPRFNFFGVKARASDPEDSRQLLRTKEVLKTPDAQFPEVISRTLRPDGRWDYVVRDWFRAYPNPEASFDHHGRVLKAKRFARAFETSNPYDFATEVHRGGYATAPNYSTVLHGIMRTIEPYLA